MYCAVYYCRTLTQFNDNELVQLFKAIQKKNVEHHITGCLVHHGDEFFQIVQGRIDEVNTLYTLDGIDSRIRYGDPIFSDCGNPFLFEFSYMVSDSLCDAPHANEIPLLSNKDLYLLHDVLKEKTLAVSFFWTCLKDIFDERAQSS